MGVLGMDVNPQLMDLRIREHAVSVCGVCVSVSECVWSVSECECEWEGV